MKLKCYKEKRNAKDEEEVKKIFLELAEKYGENEVYVGRYIGKDGNIHREVLVFTRTSA